MKTTAVTCLVLGLSAATFGFGGASWEWAKVVSVVLLTLAAFFYLGSRWQRRFRTG